MASITIRNIPDELLDKIKERAKRQRRSLNNEIIKILEDSQNANKTTREGLIGFFEEHSFDQDYIDGVEEAIKSRTYGRDISFE